MLEQVAGKVYASLGKTKIIIAVVAVALSFYAVLLAFSGANMLGFVWFALVCALYIAAPGMLAAILLNHKKLVPNFFVPLSFLYGSGFFVVMYCVCMRLGVVWLMHMIPILCVPALCFILWKKNKRSRMNTDLQALKKQRELKIPPFAAALILIFAWVLFVYVFAGVIKNARPLMVGDTLINTDLLWNIGNANSFKLAFPPQDIRFFNVRLHYHYLTELLAGALSVVSGISAYNIVAFYMQPIMLALLIVCLYSFASLFYEEKGAKPVLFVVSMFFLGCAGLWAVLPNGASPFWNLNITHLVTNVNSQATAYINLCIFLGLWVQASRQKFRISLLHTASILCAFLMLNFSKGPLAAIVICAIVASLLWGLVSRTTGVRGVLLGVALVGVFVILYITMFSSGANDSTRFSLVETLEKGFFYGFIKWAESFNGALRYIVAPFLWVVQAVLMMPAQMPFYWRAIKKDCKNLLRLSGERAIAQAGALGGVLAFFLFNHTAMSQMYFFFTGLFFVNLLAMQEVRLPLLQVAQSKKPSIQKPKLKTPIMRRLPMALTALLVVVGIATSGFVYANLVGSGARRFAINQGWVEKYPYQYVITPDDEAAMMWLKENSSKDAMFATNRTQTDTLEQVSNLYSAFGERQGFMEGYEYAKTNMGVSQQVINERIKINTAIFSEGTSPDEVLRLCMENNISYLVFSTQYVGSTTQLSELELAFTSPTVQVYMVRVYEE